MLVGDDDAVLVGDDDAVLVGDDDAVLVGDDATVLFFYSNVLFKESVPYTSHF